jgi:tetratricopeptide (TPR) repeat protein
MFRSVWEQRTQLSLAPRVARWLELTNHVPEARALLTTARNDAFARRNVASETKAWFALRLGDLEWRAGNVRRAESAYRDGLRVEPGDPRLFSAMARLELGRDHADRAIAWGERAITLQLDPATLGLVGDAYAAQGDTAKSEEYLRTLDVAVSTQPGAYHRAWALSLLDHGRQVNIVLAKAQAELRDRKDVYGYDVVAWALYQSGRMAEAKQMMARATRFSTPDPLLQYHARVIAAAPTHLATR